MTKHTLMRGLGFIAGAPIDLISGPTRLAEIQRRLETREPCDDHGEYGTCPGWRIDEADGDPQLHKLGELFIARCDACAADLITDDDAALIPEAQDELRRAIASHPEAARDNAAATAAPAFQGSVDEFEAHLALANAERANPDARGFYTWTVEIRVHETWVEDGFDLTDERALSMLAHDLRYANIGRELRARVLSAPDLAAIKKAQGH